jgi:branched-chain amino acid transport system permease protein
MVGGVYALIALGIVVVYKATSIFNFAVGQMMVIGAYLCWMFISIGISPGLAIVIALILSAGIGLLIERLALRPLIGQPIFSAIIATLALFYIFDGIDILAWGGKMRGFPAFLPGKSVQLPGAILPHELLWSFSLALLGFAIIVILYRRTKLGLGMRAACEDQQLAQARGIPVTRAFSVTWIIAAVLATVGGILLGGRLGLSPALADMGFKSFAAVLFGGLESIPGAIVGGLTIGVIESVTGGLISPELGQISPFIILILVLIFKTEGLWGLERIERI